MTTTTVAPPGAESQSAPAAARALRRRGFALCRPSPRTKTPLHRGWSSGSLEPEGFRTGDSVGILGGPLSAPPGFALVIVDLDDPDAIRLADAFLPPTGLVEGRESKPRAHRYFFVPAATIPDGALGRPCAASAAAVARCGHPGTLKTAFRRVGERSPVLDWVGTGGMVVCPPSVHDSGESRLWFANGDPAVVAFPDLWDATTALARACGAVAPGSAGRGTGPQGRVSRSRAGDTPVTPTTLSLTDISPLVRSIVGGRTFDLAEDQLWVPDDALRPTLPTGGEPLGPYGGAVLHLARALRDRFPADTAPDRFKQIVARWLALAEHDNPGLVKTPADGAAVLRALVRAFPRVTTPVSESRPMKLMRAAADAEPGNKTDKLLAACRALKEAFGGEFELSCRVAGAVLGLDHEKARLKLLHLVARGHLVVVKRSADRQHGHRYRLGARGA